MQFMDRFRDWCRGYSEADIEAALDKVERHWMLAPGSIIPFTGREMKALIGERMMPLFWQARQMVVRLRAGDGERP